GKLAMSLDCPLMLAGEASALAQESLVGASSGWSRGEVSKRRGGGGGWRGEGHRRSEGERGGVVVEEEDDAQTGGAGLSQADADGELAVIVAKEKAATLTGVVREVACGAAEVMPLVAVTNLARTLE
ncbi:hypothetical protein B1218_37955, partial [Pseudomonas ogarae]